MLLNFKTRGQDVSPQGKPRVYFCCHPDDFATYFESVSKEILNLVNCTVFYDEQPDGSGDTAEWESRLSDMQLFVMPVTSKLLFGHNKGIADYHIAIKRHIPVLPLMQEQGLDQLFNSVCGNSQYLEKHQKDETAISYQEKLQSFLGSVLVGDEKANVIRAAFRSYIFLSYRKKDRAHAQRLMRLIHKSEACRDVAIWYDEYLVPGEDFNNAIGDALNKSQLFLLAVTPNLVCEDNYVQAVEYPMAVKSGKLVLPVEMALTDYSLLASQYENLPQIIKEADEQMLMQLLSCFFPRNNKLKDDLPRYHLLALAYLDGIDVEVDHARALDMLTYCAEKSHVDSYKTIVHMYKQGKGVERDVNKAIEWQQRLVDTLTVDIDNADYDTKCDYVTELISLADLYNALLRYEKSIEIYQQLKAFCNDWSKAEPERYLPASMLCNAYNFIGEMYRKTFAYADALENYRWGLHYAEQLAEKSQNVETYNDLVTCYCNLGRCHEDLRNFEEAMKYYEARLTILNLIKDISKDDEYLFSFMQCYTDMFDVCKSTCDIPKAQQVATQALAIAEKLNQEQNDAESQDWLLVAYSRMADLCHMQEDFVGERDWHLKSLDISIQLTDQNDSLDARQTLAWTLQSLSDNARILDNYQDAEDYILKAVYLRETIVEDVPIGETKYQLSSCYISAGIMYDEIGNTERAIEMLLKAEKLLLSLVESNTAPKFRVLLADCYYRLGNVYADERPECKQSYEKGLQVLLGVYDELKDEHTQMQMSPFYYVLAGLCDGKADDKALEYYLKAFEIDLDYAQKHDSVDSWRQCVVDLKQLGVHYHTYQQDDDRALQCFTNGLDIAQGLLDRADSVKVRNSYTGLLTAIAEFYYDLDELDKAVDYYQQELTIYKSMAQNAQMSDLLGLYTVNYMLGGLYTDLQQYNKAKQCQIEAADTLVAHMDELCAIGYADVEFIPEIYCNIAKSCLALGEKDQAKLYFDKALQFANNFVESGQCDQSVVADVCRKMAEMHQDEQDYETQLEQALQVVSNSLAIAQQDGTACNLIACACDCENLARCYMHLDDSKNFIEYINIAKQLYEQGRSMIAPKDDGFGSVDKSYIKATRFHAEACCQLGLFYYFRGQLDEAIENFAPAIEMALQLVDITNDTLDWKSLANYCYYLGEFAGIEPLQKAEQVLQMLLDKDPNDNESSNLLQRVYEAMRKY